MWHSDRTRGKIIQKISSYVLKSAFKVLAYRFVFFFADSSFSKVQRLIESGAN